MEDRQPASAILIVSLILGIVALIAVSASYAKPNHNNATAGSKANILLAVNTFVYITLASKSC